MTKAAIYVRSSKDRADVSLDSQRAQLQQLASARGLVITTEFSDVVESGADENRPGYKELCAAVSNTQRGWDHLLILDTSRLARRQLIAITFTHLAQRKGVKIHYAKVPEMDQINEILVLSVLRAMDEMHSHTSREKGKAGMAENIKRGYRAGGAAPTGYVLSHVDTGIMRDGKPILKSQLALGPAAETVRNYLRLRVEGVPRTQAIRQSGLKMESPSALHLEWNALAYAGCTTWGVRHDATVGQGKRRPRSEWHIKEDTHTAMITRDEAEELISRLEKSARGGRDISTGKRAVSDYLLSSLLVSPTGAYWHGTTDRHGRCYRLTKSANHRGRQILAEVVDKFVIDVLVGKLKSPEFIDALYAQTRNGEVDTGQRKLKAKELLALNVKVDRAMDAALELEDPAPALRKVEALERQRNALIAEIEELKKEEEFEAAARGVSKETLKEMLDDLGETLKEKEPGQVKQLLNAFIEQVILDPDSLEVRIHLRFAGDGVNMVTPRGDDRYAVIRRVIEARMSAA